MKRSDFMIINYMIKFNNDCQHFKPGLEFGH